MAGAGRARRHPRNPVSRAPYPKSRTTQSLCSTKPSFRELTMAREVCPKQTCRHEPTNPNLEWYHKRTVAKLTKK